MMHRCRPAHASAPATPHLHYPTWSAHGPGALVQTCCAMPREAEGHLGQFVIRRRLSDESRLSILVNQTTEGAAGCPSAKLVAALDSAAKPARSRHLLAAGTTSHLPHITNNSPVLRARSVMLGEPSAPQAAGLTTPSNLYSVPFPPSPQLRA